MPYWQYAASARLNHLIPLDLNNDNNDELLIVDETGRAASAHRLRGAVVDL
ncbi:MAG: hypothetical protein IPG51_17505 [Chloroflexi bacterium]|nr:hypothetical protein [Chloroflexota bacterium]